MDRTVKLKGMLGIARKAGCLVFGTELTAEAVKSGKCSLVLAASDAAGNARRKTEDVCGRFNVRIAETGLTKSEIAQCVGKKNDLSIVSTGNAELAKALAAICEDTVTTQSETNNDDKREGAAQ